MDACQLLWHADCGSHGWQIWTGGPLNWDDMDIMTSRGVAVKLT